MLVYYKHNERDIKHIRSGLLFTMARACHQSGGGGVGGCCLCEHFSPAARFSFPFYSQEKEFWAAIHLSLSTRHIILSCSRWFNSSSSFRNSSFSVAFFCIVSLHPVAIADIKRTRRHIPTWSNKYKSVELTPWVSLRRKTSQSSSSCAMSDSIIYGWGCWKLWTYYLPFHHILSRKKKKHRKDTFPGND